MSQAKLYWACDSCEAARPAVKASLGDTRPCPYCFSQGMGDDHVEVAIPRDSIVPPLKDNQESRPSNIVAINPDASFFQRRW